jgi:hypothetical protein
LFVAFDEHLEEVGSVVLVALCGVVVLGLEDGVEGLVGGVEGTGFTDRFELAVELAGSVAPSVAEHALVVFSGETGHANGSGAVGSQTCGFVVEGIDLVGDFVVGVSNGLVSNPGVDKCHAQRLVAQEGCDCFEAHVSVDGLGCEGVTELVWVHMTDACNLGYPADDAGDLVPVQRFTVPDDQPVDVVITVCVVVVGEFDELWVERDVTVVVELPDRDTKPVATVDEHNSIGAEVAEFTDPQAGAGQHLNHEPVDGVSVTSGTHQL